MNNADNETRWFWMCSKCGLDTPYIVSKYVNRKGYDEYWSKHRVDGITCDFGGTAQLVEYNITNYTDTSSSTSDNGFVLFDLSEEANILILILFIAFGIIFGSILGFCVAIRTNKKFKQSVAKTRLGKSMSRNKFLYKSFGGFNTDYQAVPPVRLDTFHRY